MSAQQEPARDASPDNKRRKLDEGIRRLSEQFNVLQRLPEQLQDFSSRMLEQPDSFTRLAEQLGAFQRLFEELGDPPRPIEQLGDYQDLLGQLSEAERLSAQLSDHLGDTLVKAIHSSMRLGESGKSVSSSAELEDGSEVDRERGSQQFVQSAVIPLWETLPDRYAMERRTL